MRKLFSRQLIEARHEMLSIFEAIDLTLHDAVTAFVTDDKDLARRAQKKTLKIDARCANLEAVCYNRRSPPISACCRRSSTSTSTCSA
jgi:phosphate transport system protein